MNSCRPSIPRKRRGKQTNKQKNKKQKKFPKKVDVHRIPFCAFLAIDHICADIFVRSDISIMSHNNTLLYEQLVVSEKLYQKL